MSIVALDYPSAKLNLDVDTPVEKEWRAMACFKEPWTVSFIDAIPVGAAFWDIGANVGPYSLIAGWRGLSTIAVEPGYANYYKLCRNLAMNNLLERVTAILGAIGGDQPHFDWFNYADLMAGGAGHILGGKYREFFHRQRVMVWPLDFLLQVQVGDVPRYLKIDVDGNEQAVLEGGVETLKDEATRSIMIEGNREKSEADITKVLTGYGFKLAGRFDKRTQPDGRVTGIGDTVYLHFVR